MKAAARWKHKQKRKSVTEVWITGKKKGEDSETLGVVNIKKDGNYDHATKKDQNQVVQDGNILYVLDVSQQGILYQIVHINKIQEKTDTNSRWTIEMRRQINCRGRC